MEKIKKNLLGIILCIVLVYPCWLLGNMFPIAGPPVIAIIAGMVIAIFVKRFGPLEPGIKYTSKKVLQYAVVFLGFGLNLSAIAKTGLQSLPIILSTITVSLVAAYIVFKLFKVESDAAMLIGVGSSICGGSAIAATAPVIKASDKVIAQSISVVFFFNVLAALVFPAFGSLIGFDTTSGEAFGIFAGTAVNDTSSVTAVASTWDSMHNLGTATLDKAVVVKLTRTLAIIPIVLALSIHIHKKESKGEGGKKLNIFKLVPSFIVLFILASLITTVITGFNLVPPDAMKSFVGFTKFLSKYMIAMAMFAIGLGTDVVQLIKTGGKSLLLGACCWVSITAVSILMQKLLGFF